jgi:hypothetical protein
VLVWDALRMKNTIQIIGLAVANIAILVYTALQITQITESIEFLRVQGAFNPRGADVPGLADHVRPYLVAIPIVIAICSIGMAFVAYKLYQVFAWDILKQIGADYRMKKRFLHYQVWHIANFLFLACRPQYTCANSYP